jgi:hypothetical protein
MSLFGPLGIGITFCQSQDHRLYASLYDALDRAVELTPVAVFCETGITFGDNLTVLIPSLFKVLKVGDGTDGADDLSKSSAKMIPVAQTATREELLASLGLGFLPKSIYWELDDSSFMFPVGLSKLHNACSKQGTVRDFEVEKAARELARAVGLLLHVILQRVATYLQINDSWALPPGSLPVKAAVAGKNPNYEGVAKLVALLRSSSLDDSFATWVERNWRDLLVNPRLRERPRTATLLFDTDASAPPDNSPASASDDSDDDSPDDKTELTYIEIVVVDEENNPVNKGKYRLEMTDGSIRKGDLPSDGRIRVDNIPPGTCEFRIFQMITFGTPDKEINRSWSWESSQGNAFGKAEDAQFDASGSEHLTAGGGST